MKLIIPALLPALAAGRLVTTTKSSKNTARANRFLNTFQGKSHLDFVKINDVDVYNLGKAATAFAPNTCLETSSLGVDKITKVEVCGTRLEVIVYQQNGCKESDSHQYQVPAPGVACDQTRAAGSCVTITDTDEAGEPNAEFVSNALSWQIITCPAVKPDDLPEVDFAAAALAAGTAGTGPSPPASDAAEAADEAEGELMDAQNAAETMAMEPEVPPPLMPEPPPPLPAPQQPPDLMKELLHHGKKAIDHGKKALDNALGGVKDLFGGGGGGGFGFSFR